MTTRTLTAAPPIKHPSRFLFWHLSISQACISALSCASHSVRYNPVVCIRTSAPPYPIPNTTLFIQYLSLYQFAFGLMAGLYTPLPIPSLSQYDVLPVLVTYVFWVARLLAPTSASNVVHPASIRPGSLFLPILGWSYYNFDPGFMDHEIDWIDLTYSLKICMCKIYLT
jgi:hypothetical protein